MLRSLSVATVVLLLLLASLATAQHLPDQGGPQMNAIDKCDPWLRAQLLEWKRELGGDTTSSGASLSTSPIPLIALFVNGDLSLLPNFVGSTGGSIGTLMGKMATVRLPIDRIMELAAHPEIMRLEMAQPVEIDNDTARRLVAVDAVLRGDAPLPQSYTGRGIIVGLIDTGIDFWHSEFRDRDDTTKSRIRSIWSKVEKGGHIPVETGYGAEWTQEEINNDINGTTVGTVTHRDTYGHGTHVAATAAGRHGIAPDADIIMVGFHNNYDSLTSDVLDGAAYIYRKAQELGRPCVINASLSTSFQFHDGSDGLARGVDALLAEAPGRFFCASMGNRGRDQAHWGGFQAEKDSLWVYAETGDIYLRVPDSVGAEFFYSIIIDSTANIVGTPLKSIGQTPWRSALEVAGNLGKTDEFPYASGSVRVTSTASSLGNGHIGLLITPKLTVSAQPCIYRVMVKGKGMIHCWTNRFRTALDFPNAARYRRSDSLYVTGSPSHAENVIAVASYVNRSQYYAADGIFYPSLPKTVGSLSDFSSRGPGLGERIKPDITAPGENVISARSRFSGSNPGDHKLLDTNYRVLSGTSMSSPIVAGGVALYLERYPTANITDVRRALSLSALHDNFTLPYGTGPDGFWGYGKLNLLGALGIAPGSSGVNAMENKSSEISVYPNPSQGSTTIIYHRAHPGSGTITLYDAMGRTLHEQHLPELYPGEHYETLNLSNLPSGTYILKTIIDTQSSFTKIILTR